MWDAPHLLLTVLWTLWAFEALWCWYNVHLFVRRMRKQGRSGSAAPEIDEPPAVVVVPIKGVDAGFDAHVQGLLRQRYAQYRVLFVVEREDDPAHAALQRYVAPPCEGGLTGVRVVVAGLAERGGQKVHNQLAGLRQLDPADKVVVFADADAVPDDRWLWRLATFFRRANVGVTTGYRWFVPTDAALPSRLLSVINSSVATLLGPARRNFAWGGSMAFRRDIIEEQAVIAAFDGALSDDYQLTRTCARSGGRVYFVMRCLVASPAAATWGRLLEFGRRQYVITRVHAPFIWLIGLFGTSIYVAGLAAAIAAAAVQVPGWGWALVAAAAVFAADHGRAARRRAAVREAFDAATVARLAPALALDRWGTPLVALVHWLIILSSAAGRTITWAGVRYRMRGRQRVEILGRR